MTNTLVPAEIADTSSGYTSTDAATGVAPTELEGFVATDEAATAWSLDDGEEWDGEEWDEPRRFKPARITAVGVIMSLVAIAAAVVVVVFHLQDQGVAPPPASTPPTTTTIVVAASPTTSTKPKPRATFVANVPAARTIKPKPPNYDARFIANLKTHGWQIWDEGAMSSLGQRVCTLLQQGATPQWVTYSLDVNTAHTAVEAAEIVVTAMQTYPNCA